MQCNVAVTSLMQVHVDGIHVVCVGVGPDIDIDEINGIATYPLAGNIYTVTDYNALSGIEVPLVNSLCAGYVSRFFLF